MSVIESSTSPNFSLTSIRTRENINKRSYRKLFETIRYFIVTHRLSVTVFSKATCSVSCQSNCPDTAMCTVTEGQRLCTVMPMSMMPKALCPAKCQLSLEVSKSSLCSHAAAAESGEPARQRQRLRHHPVVVSSQQHRGTRAGLHRRPWALHTRGLPLHSGS